MSPPRKDSTQRIRTWGPGVVVEGNDVQAPALIRSLLRTTPGWLLALAVVIAALGGGGNLIRLALGAGSDISQSEMSDLATKRDVRDMEIKVDALAAKLDAVADRQAAMQGYLRAKFGNGVVMSDGSEGEQE